MKRILYTTFLFLFVTLHAFALQEAELQVAWKTTLEPFLKNAHQFKLVARDGLELQSIEFLHPEAKETLVFLPGFSETYLKYTELFYDLYQHGYTIISFDHRGQGLSPHLSKVSSQIGHIDHFENYIQDLSQMIRWIQTDPALQQKPISLLAHSMGGAIGLRYLEEAPKDTIRKIIVNAPMLHIKTEPYPDLVAKSLVSVMSLIGRGDQFAPGYSAFNPKSPFESNQTTHSPARYQVSQTLLSNHPEAQVGGPSNDWVKESLSVGPKIQKHFNTITTPILMLTSGDDRFAVNETLEKTCLAHGKRCTLQRDERAKHEVFQEQDPIRNQAIENTLKFLNL